MLKRTFSPSVGPPVIGTGTKRIPKLPGWAFHGGKDSVVPLVESQRMIDALKKNGNKHAWLTIYPEANHNSWTEAYNTEALWQWMLDQQRGKPGQPPSPHLQTKPVALLTSPR